MLFSCLLYVSLSKLCASYEIIIALLELVKDD